MRIRAHGCILINSFFRAVVAWGEKIMVMKKVFLILMCSGLVLIFLLACQWRAQVGGEGKGLSNPIEKNIQPALEDGEERAVFYDAVPENGAAEIEADTLKKKYYEPYYPIQKDTSLYHKFGDLLLKKDKLTGCYYVKNVGGYGYQGIAYYERYPGILNKQIHQGNKPSELIFYNKNRTEVLKRIKYEHLNPYLKKHKNLKHAYPSFEYYEAPPENEKDRYVNAVPDTFLTFFNAGWTTFNGYTPITYSLVPVKGNKILGWETTTVIIDKEGDIVAEHMEDNYIQVIMISDDGSLLAYIYGQYPDNPYDQKPNGEFKVMDLRSGEVVLCLEGGASFGNNGYIHRISQNPKGTSSETQVELINLNTRKRLSGIFPNEVIKTHFENHITWESLLNNTNFTETTF